MKDVDRKVSEFAGQAVLVNPTGSVTTDWAEREERPARRAARQNNEMERRMWGNGRVEGDGRKFRREEQGKLLIFMEISLLI